MAPSSRSFHNVLGWLLLRPLSRGWRTAIFAALGVAVGLAVLVARVSNAASYLTNAPETCMNCHVMTDAYASWQRGSHGRVAVCTDCHVPHGNLVAKQAFKARDGLRHAAIFTARAEPQVLRLSAGAVPVVQANCVRCHADQFAMIRLFDTDERTCWDCHTGVHGEAQSLSASPHLLRPKLPSAGLDWMKQGDSP
jgi:cytochrome c nitrite reductase small subunit